MSRALVFILLSATMVCAQRPRMTEDRELTDLDVSGWDCLNKPEGAAKSEDGAERNRLKNRPAPTPPTASVKALDTAGFLKFVGAFDVQTKNKRRKELNPAQKQQVNALEKQLVSLTAWLVLSYPGPPESTNCGDADFHDWHMELFEKSADHPPRVGDPTPIICEIAPRTQRAIFRDGIRLQSLMGFFRAPDVSYEPTGHPARQIRVTGYLLWDDEHNGTADVGPRIQEVSANKYHHPWRSTAWEIHPVVKIETMDGPLPQTLPTTPPAQATPEAAPSLAVPPAATPPPAPTPPLFVTIMRPVKIQIAYGEMVLSPGLKLKVISRDATSVVVDYMGGTQKIPLTATDMR